jgi:hypothetical protein
MVWRVRRKTRQSRVEHGQAIVGVTCVAAARPRDPQFAPERLHEAAPDAAAGAFDVPIVA